MPTRESPSLREDSSAMNSPGMRAAWRFKFTAKSGVEYNDGILPAEIAGLLDRVDEYLNSKGFAPAHPSGVM
jgi:hypothetical protein